MKYILQVCCVFFPFFLSAQLNDDVWVREQLADFVWQESYRGVLADYHPVTLMLASDHHQVAGYLVHEGDGRKHKLLGDWNESGFFQLQERDEYDRLSGYLTGNITPDQVLMRWLSPDQSRLFEVKAFPEKLIKIKRFNPVAEYISLSEDPRMYLTVQKMDFGVISGLCSRDGQITRFDGQCLDGTCSIWDAMMTDQNGRIQRIQMRQKDATWYKATIDGREYKGQIRFTTPLASKLFDNSIGFLDFIYPVFESKVYTPWIATRIDTLWNQGVRTLQREMSSDSKERLVYRASGWIEILDEGEDYVSGMITFIHPQQVQRESFLWLKRDDAFLPQEELMNLPSSLASASEHAMVASGENGDADYRDWLGNVGYKHVIPMSSGVVMATPFSMVFGDEFQLLPEADSKAMIRKKYWKYFNW